MVQEVTTKIHESQGRHTLYLPQSIVKDSAFPFTPGEDIVARIDGDRLIIEPPEDVGERDKPT